MKHLFLVLYMSMTLTLMLSGQENSLKDVLPKDILECLDKTGNDISLTLNECECRYLDYYFQKDKGVFSFCGKKVNFLRGNIGTIKSSKKEYFDIVRQIVNSGNFPSAFQQLIILDKCEAKDIGCDAVIVTGSKKYLTKKDIIKRLKKG